MRRSPVFKLLIVVFGLALVGAGCSPSSQPDTSGSNQTGGVGGYGEPPNTDLSSDDLVLTSGHMETLGSCDDLLARIKQQALERVGPYGFGGLHQYLGRAVLADAGSFAQRDETSEATAADNSAAAVGEPVASRGVSETNNQEVGVDEADMVKTDGKNLVAVFGNRMQVIDVSAGHPTLVKTIELPSEVWGGELFLSGNTALVMTSGWTDQPFSSSAADITWFPGSPIGRLIEIDLGSGTVGRILEFEGGYLSAREIDGTIRVVLSASTDRFAFVYPSNDNATEHATKANRQLIEDSSIDQWIPTYRIIEDGTTIDDGPIVDCRRVHLPSEFAGFGSLVLLTAAIDGGLQVHDSLSVLTNSQTMYASPTRVAVATNQWEEPEISAQDDSTTSSEPGSYATAIHTFDITNPDLATYVASGEVRGHLLNQYSMSEHNGYLRVATTDGAQWNQSQPSESFVTVFTESGNALKQVGQVGDLGRGERITAVRFLGEKGYVVTFRQIDPLYTVDLSDPTNPTVKGELKIPGFSSYLHPIGQNHVLGVGTDGDENGNVGGAVVSLFDVSDPAQPNMTAKLPLTANPRTTDDPGFRTGDSHSPVSNDARAFLYWQDSAVVPIDWWGYDPSRGTEGRGSDVVVVDVDTAGNLTERGRVSHPVTTVCVNERDQPVPIESGANTIEPSDPDGTSPAEPSLSWDEERHCWDDVASIRRSVIVDDRLYTLSEYGVKVSDWSTLSPIDWIEFSQA